MARWAPFDEPPGRSRFSSAISGAALRGSARCLRPRAVLVDGCEESTAGRLHQVCGRRRDRYPAAPHLHLELDFANGLASRTDRVCAERDYSRWNPGGPRDRLAERIDKAVAGPLGITCCPSRDSCTLARGPSCDPPA